MSIAARTAPTAAGYLNHTVPGGGGPSLKPLQSVQPWPGAKPWADLGNEADLSDQGAVVYALGLMYDEKDNELENGHFIFVQRPPTQRRRELPDVIRAATIPDLNLLLRTQNKKYTSIERIMDEWIPYGFVHNKVPTKTTRNTGAPDAGVQMVGCTVANNQNQMFNIWLNSDENLYGQKVTRAGMFLYLLLAFVPPPPTRPGLSALDEARMATAKKERMLGKRKTMWEAANEWLHSQFGHGVGDYQGDEADIPEWLAPYLEKGWSFQIIPWASETNIVDRKMQERMHALLDLPNGKGQMPMLGKCIFIGMSSFVHCTKLRQAYNLDLFLFGRDDPRWETVTNALPTADIIMNLNVL